MGQRHRNSDQTPLPKVELRAHAHSERHRVKGELHAMTNEVGRSLDVDECDEPAVEWKPMHHRDPHKNADVSRKSRLRHWKMKYWKRRSTLRHSRAVQTHSKNSNI